MNWPAVIWPVATGLYLGIAVASIRSFYRSLYTGNDDRVVDDRLVALAAGVLWPLAVAVIAAQEAAFWAARMLFDDIEKEVKARQKAERRHGRSEVYIHPSSVLRNSTPLPYAWMDAKNVIEEQERMGVRVRLSDYPDAPRGYYEGGGL